jgi:ferrous iron transport protein B
MFFKNPKDFEKEMKIKTAIKDTSKPTQPTKVILVGNPNVGKSVIFNYLTGSYRIVSNYPGTTVEVFSGAAKGGEGSYTGGQ